MSSSDPRVAKMQQRLNASLQLDNPSEILAVLTESADLGEAVSIERGALQERYDKIISSAIAEMNDKMATEDFQSIQDTLTRFDGYPGEAQDTFRQLQQKWDGLLESTKQQLRALIGSQDPTEIDETLKPIEREYGDSIAEEKRALADRKSQLIRTAMTEMSSLAADLQAPLAELDALLSKYATYPADVDTARKALTSELKRRVNDLAADMTRVQSSGDIQAVEVALERDSVTMETHLPAVLPKLQAYREQLVEAMNDRLQKASSIGALASQPLSSRQYIASDCHICSWRCRRPGANPNCA